MLETLPAHDLLVTLTAKIVAAYIGNHVIPGGEITKVIGDVHAALNGIGQEKAAEPIVEKPKPPISVRKSIQDDYLVCFEDGKKFKSLKRHLMAKYQMTPEQYRRKWNLPDDYPMIASAYAARRSELARAAGLGQTPKKRRS
ncbi:MAG: MucR family transcriptional regulator [Pararhizobium sp.]